MSDDDDLVRREWERGEGSPRGDLHAVPDPPPQDPHRRLLDAVFGEGEFAPPTRRVVAPHVFASWHHSLYVEPWPELRGGVRVANVDDPGQPMLLLRDRDEVNEFVAHLLAAQSESQA